MNSKDLIKKLEELNGDDGYSYNVLLSVGPGPDGLRHIKGVRLKLGPGDIIVIDADDKE
jgi:hypothetical protein